MNKLKMNKERRVSLLTNKRGVDFIKQGLELTVAVIGIFLLIVAIKLVYNVYANADSENAKTTINYIEGKINVLKDGETGEFLVQGFKADPIWSIIGWGKNNPSRPDKCWFKSCLCICPDILSNRMTNAPTFDSLIYKDAAKICQEDGICRFFDVDNIITLDNFIGKQGAIYTAGIKFSSNIQEPAIGIPMSFFNLKIEKSKSLLNLTANTGTWQLKFKWD